MFVTQRVGCVADQIEQSIATRFNVRTVLYVVRRPELLSGSVVPPVKQGVERFEHQLFVFLFFRLTHNHFLILSLVRWFFDDSRVVGSCSALSSTLSG